MYCIYDNIAEMYLKVFSTCETDREWVYGNIEDNTYYGSHIPSNCGQAVYNVTEPA